MTDNEIIKALEVCVGIHNDCGNCPLLEYSQATDECMTEAMSNALDLINRQKAEIEIMTRNNELMSKNIQQLIHENLQMMTTIKSGQSEAIKEFAEKCKNTVYRRLTYAADILLLQNDIDDLVKEMVGDSDV